MSGRARHAESLSIGVAHVVLQPSLCDRSDLRPKRRKPSAGRKRMPSLPPSWADILGSAHRSHKSGKARNDEPVSTGMPVGASVVAEISGRPVPCQHPIRLPPRPLLLVARIRRSGIPIPAGYSQESAPTVQLVSENAGRTSNQPALGAASGTGTASQELSILDAAVLHQEHHVNNNVITSVPCSFIGPLCCRRTASVARR